MGSEVEGKRQRKEKRGGKGRRRREGTPDIRIRDSVTEEIQSAFLSSLLPFLLPPSPLLPRDLLLFPEKRRRENTKEPASSLLLPVSLLIREHARTHVCMCCSQGQDAVITVQTIKEEGKTKGEERTFLPPSSSFLSASFPAPLPSSFLRSASADAGICSRQCE